MNHAGPKFDTATHYRIELQGHIDGEWLQSFDRSVKVNPVESVQREAITVLDIYADQAGIVGLVRRLHGLAVTILQLSIIPD